MKGFKTFLRSFYISAVIVLCFGIAFFGISKAYEGIRRIGFGEYRSAVEFEDGKFKFFDMTFVV